MKALLTITAIIEAGTGVVFAVAPSQGVLLLVGTSSWESPTSLVISRVLAAALLSLGAACWLARDDVQSRSTSGLIVAMLIYNIAAVLILGYARIGQGMPSIGL
jgi:hypothetical protein